ncbi:MAG: MTH938/NDUFAF3 family protein [Pseudomonadota bacterium]
MSDAAPATYPHQAAIDAYGNGGFRFAEMSHRGALLFLPTGVFAWQPADPAALALDDFAPVLAVRDQITFLMLGTGDAQNFPPSAVREAFTDMHLGLEVMDTGAACRAHNVLLAEKRAFATAVLPVD